MTQALIYHYTSQAAVEGLIEVGNIAPTQQSLGLSRGVIEVTWLSTARFWEPACRAAAELEPDWLRDGSRVPAGFVPEGAARIRVDPGSAHPWDDALLKAGMDPVEMFRLGQTAMEYGAKPDKWFITFGAVPACQWKSLQIWDGAWCAVPRQNK